MRNDILERADEIMRWVSENRPKAYMAEQLHCRQSTLNRWLKKLGIEYKGQQAKKGQYKGGSSYKNTYDYIDSSSFIQTSKLRMKLIKDGIKKSECEICGLSDWQGKKLPLELHHKDMNRYNNDINNLMILCPNCHSVQPGYTGRNIGHYKNEA